MEIQLSTYIYVWTKQRVNIGLVRFDRFMLVYVLHEIALHPPSPLSVKAEFDRAFWKVQFWQKPT